MAQEKVKPVILTIDDDVDFNLLLKKKLSDLDIELIITSNMQDFFEQFLKKRPDLCLVDLNLGQDVSMGLKIIQSIRNKVVGKLPLIVLTKDKKPETMAYAFELGASDYVTKPLDAYFLKKKIKHFLEEESESVVYLHVPPIYAAIDMSLDVEIIAIDEMGVHLRAPYYVAIGTKIVVKNQIFLEFTDRAEHSFWIGATKVLADGHSQLFCEFDQENPDLISSLRSWLVKNSASLSE